MTYENETSYTEFLEYAAKIDKLATTEDRIWELHREGFYSYDVADHLTGYGYAAAFGLVLVSNQEREFIFDEVPGCTYCSRVLPRGATICHTCDEYKGVTYWSEMFDLDIEEDFVEGYTRRHFAIMDGVGA